jgi:hypothetical protein
MSALAKYKLHIQNGFLCQGTIKAPGRPKYVTEEKLGNYLLDVLKLPVNELAKAHQEITQELENWGPEENLNQTKGDLLKEKIQEFNIFKNFVIYYNTRLDTQFFFYRREGVATPICMAGEFTEKVIYDTLVKYERNTILPIIETLQAYINPKNPLAVSAVEVIKTIVNYFKPELTIQIEKITHESHPAVLEGCNVPALKIIPFTRKDCSLDDLNPFLKEFLLRVSDHKYFCAHLYTNFIGMKTPCLLYLHGRGNDGKSIFVKMVGGISGLVCNYDDAEKFSGFNMFGKSLIIQNENKKPNILQHTILKAISGGDLIQIEQKGRNAFTGECRGQLIIVANDPINVLGTPDESRRLRYFTVTPPVLDEEKRLTPDQYLKELSSTQNEFLNYCRMCYEELKTENGMVKLQPTHKEILKSLRHPEHVRDFNAVIDEIISLKKTHEFAPDGECDALEILDIVKTKSKAKDKEKYAESRFEALLLVDYQVIRQGDRYLGLQRKAKI